MRPYETRASYKIDFKRPLQPSLRALSLVDLFLGAKAATHNHSEPLPVEKRGRKNQREKIPHNGMNNVGKKILIIYFTNTIN